MTINRNPYIFNERHYVDKDPDNKWYYVIDVTDEITKNNTTAVSATYTTSRMTVLEGPTVSSGKYITIKVTGPSDPVNQTDEDAFVQLHVTCANTEEFDKRLWFNQGNKVVVD
jgi:hypothetical protein